MLVLFAVYYDVFSTSNSMYLPYGNLLHYMNIHDGDRVVTCSVAVFGDLLFCFVT